METVKELEKKKLVYFPPSSKMTYELMGSFVHRYFRESCLFVNDIAEIDPLEQHLFQIYVWSDVVNNIQKVLNFSSHPLRQIGKRSFYIFIDVPRGKERELLRFPYLNQIRGIFYVDDSLETLRKGFSIIINGDIWVSRKILMEWMSITPKTQVPRARSILSAREMSVLRLVSEGQSNKEISNSLFISINTVKAHLYNIYRKIKVSNRLQAAKWASDNSDRYTHVGARLN